MRIIRVINLPRKAAQWAIGKEHTASHRMVAGAVIAVVGVGVAKLPVEQAAAHYFCDLFGYALHGVGIIPYAEWLIETEV